MIILIILGIPIVGIFIYFASHSLELYSKGKLEDKLYKLALHSDINEIEKILETKRCKKYLTTSDYYTYLNYVAVVRKYDEMRKENAQTTS